MRTYRLCRTIYNIIHDIEMKKYVLYRFGGGFTAFLIISPDVGVTPDLF